MNNEELRDFARKRLKARADFYNFVWIWVGVSAILTGIWFVTTGGGGYFWPMWAIGGMGIAAFFIALDAFGPGRHVITEAKVDAEVRRLSKGLPPAEETTAKK